MSKFAIAEVLPSELNALVKDLMHQMGIDDPNEAVRRVTSKEWVVVQSNRRWQEQNGVIYFSVMSDGTTGSEWITRLKKMDDYTESVLLSSDFKPTTDITYKIAVLRGMLFADGNRTTNEIRAEAARRNLPTPPAEVACLIRETFSDKEIKAMGLWRIITMHEPIKDSVGRLGLLSADRDGSGCWLRTYYGPGYGWLHEYGFAFCRLAS